MSHVPPPEESKLEEKTFGESESPGQEDAAPSTTQSNIIEEIQEPSRRIVEESQHVLAQLSPARNNFLLVIFSIAQFIDVCNVSGVAIAVAQISSAIHLAQSQIVWIITSYSLCFSAFLLFAGRLSDLFPAQLIFEGGFLMLGIFSLVTSFVTSNKFGFLILRGGAMTIPSAFHLAVHMFPEPKEQRQKLALLNLAGALGNVLGLVLAGICMLANYRWFFRVLAILCIVFSVLTILLLPHTPSSYATEHDTTPRWKRMDFIGVIIMMGALICFIFALTQGPISGWGSASFVAPFVLAFILGPLFFIWAQLPANSAILPSSIWKSTNIVLNSIVLLTPLGFWATSLLEYATFFQEVLHWRPIHVAAAMLPQGLVGLVVGGVAEAIPEVITRPQYSVATGGSFYSKGGAGMDYWRFCFPGFLLGSSGAVLLVFAASFNLITMCPPEMSGVASAWVQVATQVGGAITLAVQAGLEKKNLADWKGSAAYGYWFMLAWALACTGQFVILYKQPVSVEEEHKLARQRIQASNKK